MKLGCRHKVEKVLTTTKAPVNRLKKIEQSSASGEKVILQKLPLSARSRRSHLQYQIESSSCP